MLGKNAVATNNLSCVSVEVRSPNTIRKNKITPSWIHVVEREILGLGMQLSSKRGVLKEVVFSTISPLVKMNLAAFFCIRGNER